jgi:thymidylate synthase (FAD)
MPPPGWYADPVYGQEADAWHHGPLKMSAVRLSVLDAGYVELVEVWGSDARIIEAARMSTGKGFQGWGPRHKAGCDAGHPEGQPSYPGRLFCGCSEPGDEKLLTYLWSHAHTTPFEMCGATFEVKAPIFVFREWHRHRTQSYNEMSARYTPLPNENYLPTLARCHGFRDPVAVTNRQAQSVAEPGDETVVDAWLTSVDHAYRELENIYQQGLAAGVPKELARIVLPVGRYSKMRASANLWNWLRFLKLRLAANAQFEIREYAKAVHSELAKAFPRTLKLFDEGDSRP